MASPAALQRTWRESSLPSWSSASQWWTSAVDVVSDAFVRRRDIRAACEALGRERAEAGVFLDEARADIRIAARVASLRPRLTVDAIDAVTLGWVDRALDTLFAPPYMDALTGLVPAAYLSMRLAELWAEAQLRRRPVDQTHTLVVVRTAPAPNPIERETRMIIIQSALRAAFRGGETLARINRRCAAALVLRQPQRLHPALAVLRAELHTATHEHQLPATHTWLETVPADAAALSVLLRKLAG